jgi:hypothetical protein
MTRRLLSCFTCLLLVGSSWPAVRGESLPTGARGVNGQPAIDQGLPCSDSSAECLRRLGDLAIANNPEMKVIDQALAYQRRKVWTSWLNADGLNPLAMGLRVARNLAGGGDRAAMKLEVAQLERRRAEVEAGVRLAVAQSVAELEAAGDRLAISRARSDEHRLRLRLLTVGYRLGDGSTEEMIRLWQTGEELRGQVRAAEAEQSRARLRLESLLHPLSDRLK